MMATLRAGQRKIGEILRDLGVISQAVLDEALGATQSAGGLGRYLVDKGLVSPADLARAMAVQFHLPFIELKEYPVNPDALRFFTEEQAYRYKLFPLEVRSDALVVALADPSSTIILDDLKLRLKKEIVPVLAAADALEEAIKYYYGATYADASREGEFGSLIDDLAGQDVDELVIVEEKEEEVGSEDADAAPVIRLVNAIIAEAIRRRASDIHIDCREKDMLLRFRLDGVLHTMKPPPKRLQSAIISRIKIMSEMDISERRNPQDGHFKTRHGDRMVDFRVSTLPTIHGEKVVMRLLDKSNLRLDLTQLGLEPAALEMLQRAVRRPYGMLLVTGPTGSGKSTTLYSALKTVARADINVITVEDPVEYQLDEINQVQVRPEQGFTFAKGLRAILRQDPDVVMVGEIRDQETAEIAVRAALTGHLVLSTLHTNDAPSTLTRLVDMGIEPYLVTASVNVIIAQRLLRRVCTKCREPYSPTDEMLQVLGLYEKVQEGALPRPSFFRGVGCRHCADTGYAGRIALYEVLEMNEAIRRAVLAGETGDAIKVLARNRGMMTLRESGVAKLLAGVTSLDEVLRVTFED
ncbi:Flp pilus assembly complex ATPase component TadA [bacterium]|nr:Flp pilus assembly complex ATPase component TadA [bacterium]